MERMEVDNVGAAAELVNGTADQLFSEVSDLLDSLTESGALKINGESNDEENVKRITEWLQQLQAASETSAASHVSHASRSSPTSEPSPAAQLVSVSPPSPTSQPSPAPQAFQASEPSTSSQASTACSHTSVPSPDAETFARMLNLTSKPSGSRSLEVAQPLPAPKPTTASYAFRTRTSLQVAQPLPAPKPTTASYAFRTRTNRVGERRSMRIKLKDDQPKITEWKQEEGNRPRPQQSQQPICDDDNDLLSLGRILDFRTNSSTLIRLSAKNQESIRQKLLGFIRLIKWNKSEDSNGVKIAPIKPKERTNYMFGMMKFKPKAEKILSFISNYEARYAVIMGKFRLEMEMLPSYRNIETNYAFKIPSNTKYKIINQETDSDAYLFYKIIKISN